MWLIKHRTHLWLWRNPPYHFNMQVNIDQSPHVQLIIYWLVSITTKYTQNTNFIFFKPLSRETICQGMIINFSMTTVDKDRKWMLAGQFSFFNSNVIFNMFTSVFRSSNHLGSSITDEESMFETCMYGASNFNMFNTGILIHFNCCIQCKHDTCSRHCRIKNIWIHYQIWENLTIWHFAIEIRA